MPPARKNWRCLPEDENILASLAAALEISEARVIHRALKLYFDAVCNNLANSENEGDIDKNASATENVLKLLAKGLTQTEVGKLLGLSRQRIFAIKKREEECQQQQA